MNNSPDENIIISENTITGNCNVNDTGIAMNENHFNCPFYFVYYNNISIPDYGIMAYGLSDYYHITIFIQGDTINLEPTCGGIGKGISFVNGNNSIISQNIIFVPGSNSDTGIYASIDSSTVVECNTILGAQISINWDSTSFNSNILNNEMQPGINSIGLLFTHGAFRGQNIGLRGLPARNIWDFFSFFCNSEVKYSGAPPIYYQDPAFPFNCTSVFYPNCPGKCLGNDSVTSENAVPSIRTCPIAPPPPSQIEEHNQNNSSTNNKIFTGKEFSNSSLRIVVDSSKSTDTNKSIPYSPILNTNSLFNLYPNPNKGGFTLEYNLKQGQTGEFNIYSVLGEKVARYSLDATSDKMFINKTFLSNGIYLYDIIVNNSIVKENKLVIIK